MATVTQQAKSSQGAKLTNHNRATTATTGRRVITGEYELQEDVTVEVELISIGVLVIRFLELLAIRNGSVMRCFRYDHCRSGPYISRVRSSEQEEKRKKRCVMAYYSFVDAQLALHYERTRR